MFSFFYFTVLLLLIEGSHIFCTLKKRVGAGRPNFLIYIETEKIEKALEALGGNYFSFIINVT
jgi:hypothetical protein